MIASAAAATRAPSRGLSRGRPALFALRLCVWFAAAGVVAVATPSYAHVAVALRTARDFASHGIAATTTLGWLGSLVVALLVRIGGIDAVVFGTTLVVLATLFLVERRSVDGGTDAFALGATLLAALCSIDALAAGNGAADWFFAALLLVLLDRPTPRGALAVTLLIALWCNVSLAGLYGVALVLLSALGTWYDDRDAKRTRCAVAAVVGAAVAAAIAFALQRVSIAALAALAGDPSAGGSLPVLPAVVAAHGYRFGFTAAILSLALVGLRPFHARAALLVVASVVFALRDGAAVPLVGIVVAPLLARSVREVWNAHRPGKFRAGLRRDAPAAVVSALIVAGVLAAFLITRPVALASVPSYIPAIDALAKDGQMHRLFCARPLWCSYAYGSAGERFTVLADDRAAASSSDVARDQSAIASVESSWRTRLASQKITDVLAVKLSPLATLLREEPVWRLAGSDGDALLFRRTDSTR